MSKLTATQKEIIKALEDEFIKMNGIEIKPFKLISKEFFDKERLDIDNSIKTIGIENDAFNRLVQNMLKRDMKLLNDDISSMGLIATRYICNSDCIVRIDVKGEELTNFPRFTFEYIIGKDTIYFADGRQIKKSKGFRGISFYCGSVTKTFNDINELVLNSYFQEKMRNYYDSARAKFNI